MTIEAAASVKGYFVSGAAPTQTHFEILIDSSIRLPLVAIATAAEGGKTGIVKIVGTAAVSLEAAGAFGLQFLTVAGTASAVTLLPSTTVTFSDGSVAVPGINFSTDTDTGFYRPAANVIAIAAGGVTAAVISTAGATFHTAINQFKGANVSATATTDIWAATGDLIHVLGADAITSLGSAANLGAERTIIFDGTATFTHNAATLVLPGAANIITAPNDRAIVRADTASKATVVAYIKANGQAVITPNVNTSATGLVRLATQTISASVASVDFGSLSTTYDVFLITLSQVRLSQASDSLLLQYSYDSAATFDAGTNYNYHYGRTTETASTYLAASGTAQTAFTICDSTGAAGGQTINGSIYLFRPAVNAAKGITWNYVVTRNSAGFFQGFGAGSIVAETCAATGFRILGATDDLNGGTVSLYGLVKS